jgi:hypothetical protein
LLNNIIKKNEESSKDKIKEKNINKDNNVKLGKEKNSERKNCKC